jgi:hypothetical protein
MLAVALLLASGGARAAAETYLPLGAGARWEYDVHRDHTYRPAEGKTDRTFRAGTSVLEHVRLLDVDGDVVHELRERREETSLGPGLPANREASIQHWTAADGVVLRATAPIGGAIVHFQPPLQMVPAKPETGSRWRVGTWRSNELAIPLEGEVLGRQDLDLDGIRYEGCLEVRYAGPVSGTISVASGSAKIRDVRFERTAWWKAGVGLVQEITTTDGEIELPEGDSARVHEVTTLRLVRHTAAR